MKPRLEKSVKPLTSITKKITLFALCCLALVRCTSEEELTVTETFTDQTISATTVTTSPSSCAECTYVVPSSAYTQSIDGLKLGLKAGAVICLSAANQYKNIVFKNLTGTVDNPILITNCGGTATLNATGLPYTMKTEKSKYIRISGGSGTTYGIRLLGGHVGLTLEGLTSNVEANNIEVYNVGFAGIMAKTDPTCDDATIRANFVMYDVKIHDNYVHDTGGEGLYIGHSFYQNGLTLSCGKRLPHIINGLKVYNNKVIRAGWDGIQIGCALYGGHVYNNTVENYGYKNEPYQQNGIQFSEGSKGICYNNFIKTGPGIGINVVGYGDSFIHDNIIINAGTFGIFCDERTQVSLPGYKIINNTIITPKKDGIRMYNEYVPAILYNNIIVNPGSYSTYTYPRTGNDAYVYKLNKYIPVTLANNLFTRDINYVKFVGPSGNNYRLQSTSPAVNKGKDIKSYNIPNDFYKVARLKGTYFDIGASEY
jgi:hypothetical protein